MKRVRIAKHLGREARTLGRGFEHAARMFRQQLLERIPEPDSVCARSRAIGRSEWAAMSAASKIAVSDAFEIELRAVLRCRLSSTVPAAASEEIVPSNRKSHACAARFDAPVTGRRVQDRIELPGRRAPRVRLTSSFDPVPKLALPATL